MPLTDRLNARKVKAPDHATGDRERPSALLLIAHESTYIHDQEDLPDTCAVPSAEPVMRFNRSLPRAKILFLRASAADARPLSASVAGICIDPSVAYHID